MIVAKVFELRDAATFIPVIAIRMEVVKMPNCHTFPQEEYLMKRCGYPLGDPQILFAKADGSGRALSDPYDWNDRTFKVAHSYVLENWDRLQDGQVICVEHILGERSEPKQSEAETCPL